MEFPLELIDDDKISLLQTLRPVKKSMCSFRRIARINAYVTLLFAVLYFVSYVRVAYFPTRTTIAPLLLPKSTEITKSTKPQISSTASSESSEYATVTRTTQRVTDRPTPYVTRDPQRTLKDKSDIVCKIPQLDPFHSSVKEFIKKDQTPPKCEEKYPRVFMLGLNFTIVRESNTSEWKDCCYKTFSRSRKDVEDVDDRFRYSKKCIPMPETVTEIPAKIEYIGIFCVIPERQQKALNVTSSPTSKTLIDAFGFVPDKKQTKNKKDSAEEDDSDDKLNVVIYGIDGVSRMNFIRIMPRVHKFLSQNLSAISMDGYVKVGDNTYPNLIAALAAMNTTQIKKSCEKNEFFDDCPFVWDKFTEQGYKTSFGEDSAWMGLFNYQKNGFKRQPVDYYFRPLAQVLEVELGSDERGNAKICFGPRSSTDVVLNYMQKMALAMNERNQKYFQFLWATSLTHDYLNQGRLAENITLETFEWFHKQGYLNKTLLVVMSDHGIRFGSFRKTKQGKIEENLPFLYFVLPDWFKQKYPSALKTLKTNTNRLTTPFDLHETLLDILNTSNLEDSEIDERNDELDSQRQRKEVPRGISMFLPSPPERTCKIAGIPEHYCACHETEDLESKSSLAQQAANFGVFELNSFISKYIKCSFLSLKKVNTAFIYSLAPSANVSTAEEQAVKVSFVTSPGDAEFEGTLIRRLHDNKTESWSLSDVSRVNMYGNESHCVSDKEMKKYCYCTDLLHR